MQRRSIVERGDWRRLAAEVGFDFHTIDGAPYWDETAYYAFTLRQIEDDIEAPTEELHGMALDLVGDIVGNEQRLRQLAIPEAYWDWIAQSWRQRDPHVYGRMDLAYDANGPAKLYEFNYDTPTSLYEAAFFQWQWLEDQQQAGRLPAGSDQFNSIQEALVEAFGTIAPRLPKPVLFSAVMASREDQGTIAYLRDCALQAGVDCDSLPIEDIGISADGHFTDLDDRVIGTLFKLYPLEDLFREEFGMHLPTSSLLLIEPPWKALLSNKGILPLLWDKYRGHPNLLPAFFDEPSMALDPGWVRKPLHSREGANISLVRPDGSREETAGPYASGPHIRQAFHPLPEFDGRHALVGSWVIADRACGIGIREDASTITRDSARFVPHAIIEEGGGVLLA